VFYAMQALKDVDEDMKLCLFLTFFLNTKNILSNSQLNAILDHACSDTPTPDFVLTLLLRSQNF